MQLTWETIVLYVPYGLLFILISIASFTDIKDGQIPNILTLPMVVLAFIYHGSHGSWYGLREAVFGCMTGMGIMLLLYLFKAIGAGDVKLFAAIGTIMGLQFTLDCIMYSIIVAGLIGLLILVIRHRVISTLKKLFRFLLWSLLRKKLSFAEYTKQHRVITFPFMYAVLPAVIMTMLLSDVMEVG